VKVQPWHLTHVAAHVGTESNELADRMAMLAAQSKKTTMSKGKIDVLALLKLRVG